MKCVDCGSPCRNRCSKCSRGYCANCRDASGKRTCSQCRIGVASAASKSKAAQQHSRTVQAHQAAAPSYVPPTHLAAYANPGQAVGATPPTGAALPLPQRAMRTSLYLMSDAEFDAWRDKSIAALEDTRDRTGAYLGRRRARGTRTSTDIAMERDMTLFEDLIFAIEEIEVLRSHGGQATSSPISGFLTSYDDKLNKLNP